MAIETVTTDNLAEFAATRRQAPEPAPVSGGTGNPIVGSGEEKLDGVAPEPTGDTAGRTSKPVQPRIDELVRKAKEADEIAQELYEKNVRAEATIAKLQEDLDKVKPVEPVAPEPELAYPDPTKFSSQEEFNKAVTEYIDKTVEKAAQRKAEEIRQREFVDAQNALMAARVERAKANIPDFEAVIDAGSNRKVAVPQHIQAAIVDFEYGPEIAHYLIKYPEEEKRIYALKPVVAVKELGKLDDEFATKATPAAAKPSTKIPETTRAPAPVSKLRSDAGVVPADLSNLSFKDYKTQRLAQKRGRH